MTILPFVLHLSVTKAGWQAVHLGLLPGSLRKAAKADKTELFF
jgi:hypothetical protein